MKFINKTYHYLSAITLILFLNSIILPVGLSAASLFCGMEMGVRGPDTHTCYDLHSSDQHDDMLSSDKESCTYQQICEQALSERNNIEAIPQITKDFIVVLGYTEIAIQLSDYSEHNFFQSGSAVPDSTPPIFLLNSVFLN